MQTPMEEIKLKGSILANPNAAWETRAAALLAVAALVTSEDFRTLRQDEIKYAQILDLLQANIFSRISSQVCATEMSSKLVFLNLLYPPQMLLLHLLFIRVLTPTQNCASPPLFFFLLALLMPYIDS